jgi:hypothetical protein
MIRTLRIAFVTVQPSLVWDDGQDLSPGPQVQAVNIPLSDLASLPARLQAEVAALNAEDN